jgi:hypothetical protein
MRTRKTTILAALLCACLIPPALRAQGALPEVISSCASIRRDVERLACYDRAVADLRAGKAEAGASPETLFGANPTLNTRPEKTEEAPRDELRQISAKVVSLRQAEDGSLVLVLDNDQVWRQQDSDFRLTVESGDLVTITRASLGTFRITDTRGRSARFKRVR